ncbi:MAG: pyridoxamine 5'-phosphate oxidase family protein [Propionibacteriaceae bacterium]|jgi:nitroimidazol reductase NimA-like FMN-containing flavoprotein (pyridoxamine 5'-phosphate oxidase superfamily)|nr:pyridoxamine 5'-phosphate oxidase family protein [Propionibacteriaceae bacterium]
MAETVSPVTVLSEARGWDILASQQIGRIVVLADDVPQVFPVNYVVDGESIVLRTATGTKLNGLLQDNRVAFEVDTWDVDQGYSVVLQGDAAPITDPTELARAKALPLKPWVPTIKTIFVRIDADRISARKFTFGPEPPRPAVGPRSTDDRWISRFGRRAILDQATLGSSHA